MLVVLHYVTQTRSNSASDSRKGIQTHKVYTQNDGNQVLINLKSVAQDILRCSLRCFAAVVAETFTDNIKRSFTVVVLRCFRRARLQQNLLMKCITKIGQPIKHTLAVSERPHSAAKCSGVRPYLSKALTSAPFARRYWTTQQRHSRLHVSVLRIERFAYFDQLFSRLDQV